MLDFLLECLLWVWGVSIVVAFIKGWKPSQVIGHWRHYIPDTNLSTVSFYFDLTALLKEANIPYLEIKEVKLYEGIRFITPKRFYLRVSADGRVMDICGAKYGDGFFVSWWLFEKDMIWKQVVNALPWLGPKITEYLDPFTYYRFDTAVIFQSMVHYQVVDLIDRITKEKGTSLSEQESKPELMDVFKR